jgi:hypothetical protein
LPYLGVIGLIPFIGFTVIYLYDLRKTGIETDGAKIWWNDLRPIHAALYYIFSVMAMKKKACAYVALYVDVIIGFFAFIFHRIQNSKNIKLN